MSEEDKLMAFLSGSNNNIASRNTAVTNITNNNNTSFDSDLRKANGSASLEDFIEMVSRAISRSSRMRNANVKFEVDEGAKIVSDPTFKLDSPYIKYKVITRQPTMEQKPRIREQFKRNNGNGVQLGSIYGQKMDCIVQFDIIACDYKTANSVMNSFEDLMIESASYFKENGVSEILFKQQYTDAELDTYRENTSVRSLQYRVLIEKLYTVYSSVISNTNESSNITL